MSLGTLDPGRCLIFLFNCLESRIFRREEGTENSVKMMGMRGARVKGKCEDIGKKGKALGKRSRLRVE